MFAGYQLQLEQMAPDWAEAVVTCGYTNGVVGYVPTADEFPKGGYEVLHAYRIYGHQQMLAPGCEAAILGK